ncbi:MAG: ABC transporter ATP-binding protein [Lachnospiraceae bacterium]|nr:ABC transporter ATP-binding protein [Lachnospiraceae bacterium]
MKKVLIYLKYYKKQTILAPLFKMLEASFELFVPLVIASMIDRGIEKEDTTHILWMGGVLVLLGIIGLVCSVTAQYFSAKAATGFASRLRTVLFSHIQKLSFSQLDAVGTATLITRMTSDVNQVQSGVNLVLRLFLRSPFIVFGAMIMAFAVDVKAALIFVVTIPLLSIVVFGIMLISIPLYKKVQIALDKVLGKTRENLTGIRVIRAFNKEDEEKEVFYEKNEELNKIQVFVGRFSALMNPVTYLIVNGAILYLIWTGAWQVEAGALKQGEVVALVNYMSQILVELVKLANLIITVTKAIACANRIEEVLDLPVDETTDEDEIRAEYKEAVVFENVTFSYHKEASPAISDISFAAKKGETIGIIGGTGSGKSTIVNMLPGFYKPTHGKIYIDGKNVNSYEEKELKQKIGMVMQKAVLFKGSIADNLRFGKEDATEEEMWQALTMAQAKEFVEQKEGGLAFKIHEGGKNLSGGQRQRLTIARALVKKPEILVLDDSASALDYATDAALRRALKEIGDEKITFIVSQRAASIMHADQILVLDEGEIVGIGTHEDLLKNCQVYKEIYHSQFKEEAAV